MPDYKDDIEKYLKGELTPSEMNALEKKALHDPFLADALEGVQHLQPENLTADLNELQVALRKRILKQNSVVWLWTARIAAGLLILFLSTYLVLYISKKDDSKNLALNKQKESASAPKREESGQPVFDSLPTKKDNLLSFETQSKEEPKGDKARSKLRGPEQPVPQPQISADESVEDLQLNDERESKASIPAASEEPKPFRIHSDEKKELTEIPATQSTAEGKRSDDMNKDLAKRNSSGAAAKTFAYTNKTQRKIIQGKVTFSDDGTDLPGVNVMVRGTNEGTVSDAEGNYQISLEDPQSTLVFSFIGFFSKEVKVNSEELNVQLEADVSELSEVVVVGYSESNSDNLPTPLVMELAAPAGGRKVFKQYLEGNIRYPEQALINQVEGKVTVQFTIDPSGQLMDFKVVRGIGFGCDEEVIRLIKAGPKWSPTKKNDEPVRDKAMVRLRFTLPKK